MRRSTVCPALVLASLIASPTLVLAQADDQNMPAAVNDTAEANRAAAFNDRDDGDNWGWLGLLGLAGLFGLKRRDPTPSREHVTARQPGQSL